MNSTALAFDLATPALHLAASLAPWDMEVFGFPVAQIYAVKVNDRLRATNDYVGFQEWLDEQEVRVTGCRLPHGLLQESMFLEAQGFRFIEMVLHPHLQGLAGLQIGEDSLVILPAREDDLTVLEVMAGRVFRHERYHVDPRLDPRLGDQRYSRWVKSSLHHPHQRLLKIQDCERLVAFFIVENREDNGVYWHLTAIATEWQGQGYGRRVWRAMLRYHQHQGLDSVTTTISARNIAVLNLYARLGFHFLPPEMTFHWVREGQ